MDWIEVEKTTHPVKDSIWVKVIAEIKNNETGEIVEYESDEILENGESVPNVFNWEENNFSCDCNRFVFFCRAKGLGFDIEKDSKCSDGKYSVNLKNKKNGEVYYREFETEKS